VQLIFSSPESDYLIGGAQRPYEIFYILHVKRAKKQYCKMIYQMESILQHIEPTFQNSLTESMAAHGIPEGALKGHIGLCKYCSSFLATINTWHRLASDHGISQYMIAHDKLANHLTEEWLPNVIKSFAKSKKTTRYELGAREFTLTYSPKWFGDEEARIEMIKAINKLIKYYKDEIIDLRAVGEVGTNGLSHVHCFYKLIGGLKITDKNFKRAWKHWNPKKPLQRGFEGGHHASVKNEADFLGYIDKDIETAWLDKNIARENIQNGGSSALSNDETFR